MNKLAVTDIHANVPAVRARLEEDQISRLQTVLRYLYTAMDLLARRARQIKMRRIAEQMLHKRGAIHSAVRGAAPLIVSPFPFLVLIQYPGAEWACLW